MPNIINEDYVILRNSVKVKYIYYPQYTINHQPPNNGDKPN
jgi:hypothetical protein